jgi:hypothetical protein
MERAASEPFRTPNMGGEAKRGHLKIRKSGKRDMN